MEIYSPSHSDTEVQYITVERSYIEAIIYDGFNGTLFKNTSDVFTFSGEELNEPVIVTDGGEDAAENVLSMQKGCAKSYYSLFVP